MLHVALGVAAGMAHAKGTGQCCGGAIDIPEGPNIPKVLNFHSYERYYSSSFHVSTGCQEGRLAVLPIWWTDLLPFGATTTWLFLVKEM